MKYRIIIPPPKAKRMAGRGKIVLTVSSGCTENKQIIDIGVKQSFDFTMPDDVPYYYNNRILDGPWFNIEVLYSNETQTRQESIRVVPEIC